MDRRCFLSTAAAFAGLGFNVFDGSMLSLVSSAHAQDQTTPFSRTWLLNEARRMAGEPYDEKPADIPAYWRDLSYDQYRDIRFKSDRALWREEPRGFQVDLLHTGFIFRQPIAMHVIEDGQARRLVFNRDLFDYGPSVTAPEPGTDLGYTGLRVRRPINQPDVWDEFAVFQGATYFRAVAAGQQYGLSARGLALSTGDPKGEEFPYFRTYWIERPQPGATALVVHALLDSPSTTGALRFTLRPGPETIVDVEMTLFPRKTMTHVGLGPLTSMFLFDASNRGRFDDFRPAVHDSDGLAIWTGANEWIWRPLANPSTLQISAFVDQNPRGFGLMQRRRSFADYEDLEARYDLRPSAWVEPVGDWGQGAVELVEIPTDLEIHDNIVAYWRPRTPIEVGQEFSATYRLYWASQIPDHPGIAKVTDTRSGQGSSATLRRFVIDYEGTSLPPMDQIKVAASASVGQLVNVVLKPNVGSGGVRVSFELETRDIPMTELRVLLTDGAKQISETWLYRWTA